jgi:hypothetical protein
MLYIKYIFIIMYFILYIDYLSHMLCINYKYLLFILCYVLIIYLLLHTLCYMLIIYSLYILFYILIIYLILTFNFKLFNNCMSLSQCLKWLWVSRRSYTLATQRPPWKTNCLSAGQEDTTFCTSRSSTSTVPASNNLAAGSLCINNCSQHNAKCSNRCRK